MQKTWKQLLNTLGDYIYKIYIHTHIYSGRMEDHEVLPMCVFPLQVSGCFNRVFRRPIS